MFVEWQQPANPETRKGTVSHEANLWRSLLESGDMTTSRMLLLTGVAVCCVLPQGKAEDGWRATAGSVLTPRAVSSSVSQTAPLPLLTTVRSGKSMSDGPGKVAKADRNPPASCGMSRRSNDVAAPAVQIAEYRYRSRANGWQKAATSAADPQNTPGRSASESHVAAPAGLFNSVQPVSFSRTEAVQPMAGPNFQTEQAPFLGMRNFDGESTPSAGASSETAVAEVNADESFIDELHGLVNNNDSQKESGSYLTDLNSLLGGKSDWIMTNGSVLDLAADEPEPGMRSGTYLSDLRNLLRNPPIASRAEVRSHLATKLVTLSADEAAQQQTAGGFYRIPPTEQCDTIGGNTVDGLFPPVNSIHVGGHSTAPPKLPKHVDAEVSELKLPNDLACGYLQADAPACYFTEGYGLRRAPRNTHNFCNNPLYFEDANLERCGQSNGCLTTAHSAVLFTTKIAFSPYLTTVDHPRDCVSALPDCPTCHAFDSDAYFPPWSWKAAAVQAAAVTGLVYIIP